jgi:hypothetical protein
MSSEEDFREEAMHSTNWLNFVGLQENATTQKRIPGDWSAGVCCLNSKEFREFGFSRLKIEERQRVGDVCRPAAIAMQMP